MRLCLLLLVFGCRPGLATPIVQVALRVAPATHSIACRYRITLPASDTTTVLRLNLSRRFDVRRVRCPQALWQRVTTTYYLGDTLHRVEVRYAAHPRRRQLELLYTGPISPDDYTSQGILLSGHSGWLPFRPYEEYELVAYRLAVQVPAGYQVRSTTPPRRQRAGRWLFGGTTSAIELTAFVAQRFYQAASTAGPTITLVKPGVPLTQPDTALLRKAEGIIAFYNRTIGQQDPIARFTLCLPGTNHGAYALLANAAVITYTDLDVAKREDLLILAHEISHKWWAYGSFHTADGWLSEAFATYSSLLYLQASGNEAGYQAELTRLAQSAAGTPPLWHFDRTRYEPAMYRRVIYNKGTVVLAALRKHIGDQQFTAVLAQTAAQQTSTTAGFVATTGRVAGAAAAAWLTAELQH